MYGRRFGKRRERAPVLAVLFGAAVLLACTTASAATVEIGYYDYFYAYHASYIDSNYDGTYIDNGNGTYQWYGTINVMGDLNGDFANEPVADINWNMTLDPDPFISAVFSLTNNTLVTNTFTLTSILPVSPVVPAGSPMLGASTISVADASGNGDGATMDAPAGSAIYNAQIDLVTEHQLFVDPYPALVAAPNNVNSDNASFSGLFTSQQVDSNISIFHHFTLTPGDSATVNSLFRIDNIVPEPSSVVILLTGALVVGIRRLRRRR